MNDWSQIHLKSFPGGPWTFKASNNIKKHIPGHLYMIGYFELNVKGAMIINKSRMTNGKK